jgi:hypothetical protein
VENQPAPNGRDLSKAFATFSEQLRKEGLFDPSFSHGVYRVSELFLLHALGYYLIFETSFLPVGFLILGIAQGRCGWLMHEAGHYSLTGVCEVYFEFCFVLLKSLLFLVQESFRLIELSKSFCTAVVVVCLPLFGEISTTNTTPLLKN